MDLGQLAIQDLSKVDVIFYTAAPIAETEEVRTHFITYLRTYLKLMKKNHQSGLFCALQPPYMDVAMVNGLMKPVHEVMKHSAQESLAKQK